MKLYGLLLIGLTAIIIAADGSVGSSLSTSASVGSSMSTTISSTVMTPTTDGSGEWTDPSPCIKNSSCNYTASWTLDPVQDVITFTIVAKQPANAWTAIGIAPKKIMETVDVVFGYINNQGQGVVYDGWIGTHQTPPTTDSVQNLINSSITNMDGYLTLKFSRYRQSSDQQNDYSFTNTDCYYFMFPVGGGPYNNDVENCTQHYDIPMISTDKICIRNTGIVDSSMSTSGSVGSSTSTSGSVESSMSTSGSTGL